MFRKKTNFFWLLLFTTLMNCQFLCGEIPEEMRSQKMKQLEQCLEHTWGIDLHTKAFIGKYFKSSFESEAGLLLIDDFIDKSISLNIEFPLDKELECLSPHDGVIQATKFHTVVFESPYVRIMVGSAEPGEREPFHSHAWKSLLVIFEDATYLVEYANETTELLILQAGVYELPPEELYACTNLGAKKENCLRFEVKE